MKRRSKEVRRTEEEHREDGETGTQREQSREIKSRNTCETEIRRRRKRDKRGRRR